MEKTQLLLAMYSEVSEEIRSRRDPEHIYTAAAIGAFGAVAWGVATIATIAPPKPVQFYMHPAIVAAAGCILLSAAVIAKIVREHDKYCGLREEQIRIVHALAQDCAFAMAELPKGFQKGSHKGPGYLWSIGVVLCAAIAAIAFCLSVWCFK